MAQVTVDIHTRLVTKSLRRTENDIHRHFVGLGRDAGRDFGANLARGIERSTPRITGALDDSTAATDRLRAAEDRLQRAYKSGDREAVIKATNRLTKVHRDATTEVDRLARAQSNLANAMGGGDIDRVGNDVRRVTRDVSQLGSTFAGVGRVASPAAIAAIVPALGALVGVAAQATGAIGLLPGVLGAAGAAFGTAKLATMGFSDALENVSDPQKFAEALRKLSPAAQQTALSIQGMMPAFKDLQQATQESLFSGMGPQLNSMMNSVLPQIQQLTTGVADSLNQMMSGVMTQLSSTEGLATMASTVNNIVAAFQNLAPAAQPFTQAIMELVDVGSSFMPQIADSITEGAKAFAAFIDEASRTGELQEWIEKGIDAMSQLGPITLDVLKSLAALAPIGERVLPLIADTIEGIATAMPPIAQMAADFSPLFRTWEVGVIAVSGAFDIVTEAANDVIPVINRITEAINTMLAPVRAAIDLANNVPGVSLPTIPQFGPINQIGSEASVGPGGSDSRDGRGRRPGTAGLPPFTSSPLPSSANSWWNGAALNLPQGWNPAESYRDQLREITSGGAGAGTQGPVAEYSGDPMSLIQGLPVTSSLYGAAGSVLDARHRRAQAEAELNATLADNDSTAEQIQQKRNDLAKAEREQYEAELRLGEAKQSAAESQRDSMRGLAKDLEGIGAQFDSDFGISDGLGGVLENLVEFVASLAAAPLTGPLSKIANQYPGAGKGLFGMAAGSGAFGPQYLMQPQGQQAYPTSYPGANTNANQMMALAQHANGGQYDWGSTDLVNGLADCSGAVSELVSVLNGRGTGAGRLFNTDTFPEYAAENGWTPGYTPGGLNVGVRQGGPGGGHMAATLPNGVNFEAGGGTGGIAYGGPAAGALDFPQIWSRPVGPTAPMAPTTPTVPLYSGANTNPALTPPSGLPSSGAMQPGTGFPNAGGPTGFAQPNGGSQIGSAAGHGPRQYGARAPGQGGWDPSGSGFAGIGGLPMSAIQAGIGAAGAAGAPFGGQAGAAAAQMGVELLNRTAGWGGQAAGILYGGLLETFGMNQSLLGDPNQSWFGRIFSGFAGARPAMPASAGQGQEPLSEQQQDPNKTPGEGEQENPHGPTVHIENFTAEKGRDGQQMVNDLAHASASAPLVP